MRDGVYYKKENAVANDTKSATTWHAVRDSTCAAAQVESPEMQKYRHPFGVAVFLSNLYTKDADVLGALSQIGMAL